MLFSGQSYRNFIDSVMIFGATMEPQKNRVVIRVQRQLTERRCLAWMVALMLDHDVDMKVCDTADPDRVVYRSKPLMFTLIEYNRWYGPLGKRLPSDVQVTKPLLVSWAVASLAASKNADRVSFNAPQAGALLVDRIVREATAMGIPLKAPADDSPYVHTSEIDQLSHWLNGDVPRAAWDRSMPVEA